MPCAVLKSSIGKKAVMAVSGLALLGFVIAHLCGNLLIFAGPDALNGYAKKVAGLGPLLWTARIGLLAMVGAHIASAVMLTLENREARPVGYAVRASQATTYAARTMMVSGVIVLAYIVYHLLHFTFRVTNPEISRLTDTHGHHDVYSMVVLSFQNTGITVVYVLSMLLLSIHLSHGISSMFQSLGWNNEKTIPLIKWTGVIVAILICLGYISIPLAVQLEYLTPAGAAS